MTVRAVILGLAGALAIAGLGYLNDSILELTMLVGNHMPISVFGTLLILAVAVNPVLFLLRRRWRFRPSELAVIVALMLVTCSIPSSGLMRVFSPLLIVPTRMNRTNTSWQKTQALSYVPREMLPAGGEDVEEVVGAFYSGADRSKRPIALSDVPWQAWRTPLTFWMPLIFLMAVGVICLALIVHPQWSRHERLRYPIAAFATTLMAQEPKRGIGPIFRSRLFWIGLAAVLAIRIVNGIHVWYPSSLEIPLLFDFTIVQQTWTSISNAPGWRYALEPKLFPLVVGFAYFLASDVGLSLGLSNIVVVPILIILVESGVDVSSTHYVGTGLANWQLFGSYLGLTVMIAYTGRRYYLDVVRQGLGFRKGEAQRYSVWAFRGLLLAFAGMVFILVSVGLGWPIAVLAIGLTLLLFLVMARINAESGLFFCHPRWQAIGALTGLMGAAAMGPKAIAIVGVFCAVMTIDPRECMMPFIINSLKMTSDLKVRASRIGPAAMITVVLGLAVAVPVVLWANYNFGMPAWDDWANNRAPKLPIDEVARSVGRLDATGQLDESLSYGPFERFAHVEPDRRFLWGVGAGFALVVACSFMRLRHTWWPLHPVIFLVWQTWPLRMFGYSFLLGWAIKSAITKFGTRRAYEKCKVLMIGVIAGDILAGLLFMAVGAIYYAATGKVPEKYFILPN